MTDFHLRPCQDYERYPSDDCIDITIMFNDTSSLFFGLLQLGCSCFVA